MNNSLQFPYQTTMGVQVTVMGKTTRGDVPIIFYEDHLEYANNGSTTYVQSPMSREYTNDEGAFAIKMQSILSISQDGNRVCIKLKKPFFTIKEFVYIIKDGDVTTQQYNDHFISKLKEQQSYCYYTPEKSYYISIALHIILLLFTFGIWHLVWVYKTTNALNNLSKEPYRSPIGQLLLYMFVPFYAIYWMYKSAQRIDSANKARGENSEFATIAIILSIFIPVVAVVLMQDKINHIG